MRSLVALLGALAVGCSSDGAQAVSVGTDDAGSSSGMTSAMPTTTVPTTTATGSTTAASSTDGTGPGTDSESTGTTGSVDPLVGTVVARYYLDDAMGQPPGQFAADAAASPLDLELIYGGQPSQPSFLGQAGARGLDWLQVSSAGVARATVGPGKFVSDLGGSTAMTIEAVIDIDTALGSQLVALAGATGNRLVMTASGSSILDIGYNGATVGNFQPALTAGRMVVHAVIDSSQGDMEQRTRLYIDGSATTGNVIGPAQNEPLVVDPADDFLIGNGRIAAESPDGLILYAAVYSEALSQSDIDTNVEILTVSDDRP